MAHRAALRVLPLWGREMDQPWARTRTPVLTALPVLRSALISEVAALVPTSEILSFNAAATASNAATDAAAARADAASATASTATAYAATAAVIAYASAAASAAAAAAARAAFWEEVKRDAADLEGSGVKRGVALWRAGVPDTLTAAEQKMLDICDGEPPERWAFWRRWWASVRDGKPLPLPLLQAIAERLDDDAWSDPDKAAEAIRKIEEALGADQDDLNRAVAATPNAERLEINPETRLVRSVPLTDIFTDFLRNGLDRMRDAAEMFGDIADGNNPYGGLKPDVEALTRAIERYADRPQRLHDVAYQLVRRIERREDIGDCPTAAQDPLIASCKAELVEAAEDFRRHDPEVQKVVDARVDDKLDKADPKDAAVLVAASPDLARATEGDLPVELVDDAKTAADPDADPVTRRNALYRFASRAFRVYRIARADPRKAIKETADLATDVGKIIAGGTAVNYAITYLLSLF